MSETTQLAQIEDVSAVVSVLTAAGLDADASASKAELLGTCASALREAGHDGETQVRPFFLPGRIDVFGRHADYPGGSTTLAATNRGFCYVAAPRDDRQVRLFAPRTGESIEIEYDGDVTLTAGHWSNYPMTVVRRSARNFPGELRGMDLAFSSDLPGASGMSSSSVMVVGSWLCANAVNRFDRHEAYRREISSKTDLAGYLGCVENGQNFGTLVGDKGVGTFGGSEDHTAILCCKAGVLSQYAYCPVRFERDIVFPGRLVIAVGVSGVSAEKTGDAMAKFNKTALLTGVATELWNAATGRDDPHLTAAIRSAPDAADRMREILRTSDHAEYSPGDLIDRFDAFHHELVNVVPRGGDALAAGDLEAVGRIVDESMQVNEHKLKNQIPETLFLAQSARRIGAHSACSFGAGFGGSVYALVAEDDAPAFLERWRAEYRAAHSDSEANASFFATRPGPCAMELL